MCGEILSGRVRPRYWSYRLQIGAPSLAVTVVINGGSVFNIWANVDFTWSLSVLDNAPSVAVTGKRSPATSAPASRQSPASLPAQRTIDLRTTARLPS